MVSLKRGLWPWGAGRVCSPSSFLLPHQPEAFAVCHLLFPEFRDGLLTSLLPCGYVLEFVCVFTGGSPFLHSGRAIVTHGVGICD